MANRFPKQFEQQLHWKSESCIAKLKYDAVRNDFSFYISPTGALFAPIYENFRFDDNKVWSLIADCILPANEIKLRGLLMAQVGEAFVGHLTFVESKRMA